MKIKNNKSIIIEFNSTERKILHEIGNLNITIPSTIAKEDFDKTEVTNLLRELLSL